jgi:hypothetical protein
VSDPIIRTSSAYGVRDLPSQQKIQDAYEDGYASESEGPRRRYSLEVLSGGRNAIGQKTQAEYDREVMPPPPRPGILQNRTSEHRPDISALATHISSETKEPPFKRRISFNGSGFGQTAEYDFGSDKGSGKEKQRLEENDIPHANASTPRQGYYGQSTVPSKIIEDGNAAWDDTVIPGNEYDEYLDGPTIPLTAEALRQQHAGTSRTTKSSGSQVKNRTSITTMATTGSGSEVDNEPTIRVKGGQARIMVGGAQIDCTDGGEIEIKRQKIIRNGSERSSSWHGVSSDDRRSLFDRLGRPSRERIPEGYLKMFEESEGQRVEDSVENNASDRAEGRYNTKSKGMSDSKDVSASLVASGANETVAKNRSPPETTDDDFYYSGGVGLRDHPHLFPRSPNLIPSEDLPSVIPQVSPDSSSDAPNYRKTTNRSKNRPSRGDAVLVSFMDGGKRPEIARLAGQSPLASDDEEDERPVKQTIRNPHGIASPIPSRSVLDESENGARILADISIHAGSDADSDFSDHPTNYKTDKSLPPRSRDKHVRRDSHPRHARRGSISSDASSEDQVKPNIANAKPLSNNPKYVLIVLLYRYN